MEKPKPIKRHKSLQPLSRDHHYGLLVCWKIRQGLKKGIELYRIKSYTDWFWNSHLEEHFRVEEDFLFPILGNEHEMVKKALAEHRRIKRLFLDEDNIYKTLSLLEEELEKHIRFEERGLFNMIQIVADSSVFSTLENSLEHENYTEDWNDKFWERES
ncbi:hypothetical protein Belba_3220 [Belliella baltica DSM 15883]|uniref:Hemerythrin-like domain-containing protein n=1 Tax=Belliella baltica (strain DSM 15883 / CIP 108006 / LMG 21964 / BA134) TaxID=866536 RepID=I3Z912_BELBD|nr:hemerythrin domain-containing protein [Belliella baltica]AFL85730.1 hypothetical protein Belba_3220 [Belliella baltica DSM 15883]